jgi:UDP-galactopyranose mutase
MHVIVLSHLRWDFVYQRPQHLLSRCARKNRVWYVEEPVIEQCEPWMHVSERPEGVKVCVPHLPAELSPEESLSVQWELLDELIADHRIQEFALWYYTPMAIGFTRHLHTKAAAVVYDCMDELSAFRGAPPGLTTSEAELFKAADLVFTGGQSLYESKKHKHPSVHAFPSSIEPEHFRQARTTQSEPEDQREIPHPRLGYAGVIDERLDINLMAEVASMRPDWHFVMVGPVVKISDADLPKAPNIHYLGGKQYRDLPAYMSGWQIGMLPFARNEATRFISPTKTPEYLAAGLPVVSTSITDVVNPYGIRGLAEIADTPEDMVAACERLLQVKADPKRLQAVDEFLSQNSWDLTWRKMSDLLCSVAQRDLKTPPLEVNPRHADAAQIV